MPRTHVSAPRSSTEAVSVPFAGTVSQYQSPSVVGVMLAEMIKVGMGIGALPKWLVDDAVARGELVPLFPLDKPSPILYAAYMNRAFLSVKIRCFIDFLSERLNQINMG